VTDILTHDWSINVASQFGSIAPQNPAGVSDMHVIQAMDNDVIAIHFTNTTKVATGLAEDYLLFLSTDVSSSPTAPRTLNITLRDDVLYTMPIEPDAFQGQPQSCTMRWTGSKMPLTLAGGGAQLVTYKLSSPGGAAGLANERAQMIGRKPLLRTAV
jgi:hypothetical protein